MSSPNPGIMLHWRFLKLHLLGNPVTIGSDPRCYVILGNENVPEIYGVIWPTPLGVVITNVSYSFPVFVGEEDVAPFTAKLCNDRTSFTIGGEEGELTLCPRIQSFIQSVSKQLMEQFSLLCCPQTKQLRKSMNFSRLAIEALCAPIRPADRRKQESESTVSTASRQRKHSLSDVE